MNVSNRTQKLIIYSLTLLAFLLRAYQLGAQSYWIDEAWTAYFANLSFGEMWHLLRTIEPLPPFYHPSTIYWAKLVGDGEYELRFYSLVFGVMAVPLTYRLGKDLGDARLGLLAALFMTVSPYQIWHSQEARMYSILAAAAAMSMWGFVNVWQRGGWRWWLVYVVGTAWAIMNHYHGLVLIGMQGLFVLLTWRRRWRSGQFMSWASALAAIILTFGAWLLVGGNLLLRYDNWIKQTHLWDTYVRSAIAYSLGELVPRAQAIPLTLVFVAFYVLGLIYVAGRSWGAWRGSEVTVLLLAFTLAPNLAAWIYGEIRTPVYKVGPAQTVVPLEMLPIPNPIQRTLDGLELVGYALPESVRPGEEMWLWLYWRAADGQLPAPESRLRLSLTSEGEAVSADVPLLDSVGPMESWQPGQVRRAVYHLPTSPRLSGDQAEVSAALVSEGGHIQAETSMASIELESRRRQFKVSPITHQRSVSFEYPPLIKLIGFDLNSSELVAGDDLSVTLYWQAEGEMGIDYTVFLQLLNGDWQVIAQEDTQPQAGAAPTSTWLTGEILTDPHKLSLPIDLPRGDYRLITGMYDPITGRRMPVSTGGDFVDLETVTVR